jgi:RimJ/RimL family protein N-acetyltransferase
MYEWMCNPNVSANIGLRVEPSMDKTLAWINSTVHDPLIRANAIRFQGQHVGNVVLDHVDSYISTVRLSIYIGAPEALHSGVGLTASYLAIIVAFTQMNMHKVWLTVHERNHAAINTYTKLGFILEGCLREEFLLNGERLSLFYMGLLASQFDLSDIPVSVPNTSAITPGDQV